MLGAGRLEVSECFFEAGCNISYFESAKTRSGWGAVSLTACHTLAQHESVPRTCLPPCLPSSFALSVWRLCTRGAVIIETQSRLGPSGAARIIQYCFSAQAPAPQGRTKTKATLFRRPPSWPRLLRRRQPRVSKLADLSVIIDTPCSFSVAILPIVQEYLTVTKVPRRIGSPGQQSPHWSSNSPVWWLRIR